VGGGSWRASSHLFSRSDVIQPFRQVFSKHTLDGIHCGQLILGKLVKLMPPILAVFKGLFLREEKEKGDKGRAV